MHKYRNNKLPASFSGIFLDTTTTDMMQSRHNDYNYQKLPAIKKILESKGVAQSQIGYALERMPCRWIRNG